MAAQTFGMCDNHKGRCPNFERAVPAQEGDTCTSCGNQLLHESGLTWADAREKGYASAGLPPPLYAGEQSRRTEFEQIARERGYVVESCSEFNHGWTLLLGGGVELVALSTAAMKAKIRELPSRLPAKQRWYFTFGNGQPNAGHYFVVDDATFREARAEMLEKFGRLWAFQYDETEWNRDGVSQAERYGLAELKL